MATKAKILAEIRRLAEASGGTAPGWRRLLTESGIGYHDWWGKYWAKWSDAVREAGLSPNEFGSSYEEGELLDIVAVVVKELGHFPTRGELRLEARKDKGFPSDKTIRRLGTRSELAAKLLAHAATRPELAGVAAICEPIVREASDTPEEDDEDATPTEDGFVYLLKSGRFYKIGHTNSLGRREYELAIQLPEKVVRVHEIRTDDPSGIESYWHQRFSDRRKNGEWFELTREDVAAFRRRKFM